MSDLKSLLGDIYFATFMAPQKMKAAKQALADAIAADPALKAAAEARFAEMTDLAEHVGGEGKLRERDIVSAVQLPHLREALGQ